MLSESAKQMRLKDILDETHIDNEKEILEETCLKNAHAYCKARRLTGQEAGPLIELYIKEKYKMLKNPAHECNGDLSKNGSNYEVKASLGGKQNKKFNYVQLRMNHKCNYILTAYHLGVENVDNLGDLYIFRLNKSEMINLVYKYGGYAHGTLKKLGKITKEDLENVNNDKEYAIRPNMIQKKKKGESLNCWDELMKYRITEDEL
tara:strand:+ start:5482 stop:6096 length:615 start_codon:yes stop_codon:yes gene_type:complete